MNVEIQPPYLPRGSQEMNQPEPSLGREVFELENEIETTQNHSDDPAFNSYKTQTLLHLKHVSFDFRVAEDSPDYVHPPVIEAPFPIEPTKRQIKKAQNFIEITNSGSEVIFSEFGEENPKKLDALQKNQYDVDRAMIDNPNECYQVFHERINRDGFAAEFPEFEPTLDYLYESLLNPKSEVVDACKNSPILIKLREITLQQLRETRFSESGDLKTPQYHQTIFAIESAMEFFDIQQRSVNEMPGLYHSDRYEYYLHFLVAQPDHILYPTITKTGATDLLKLRQVPIGVAGVSTEIGWVDGFSQTSYEFFHHDINHSRRMYQFFKEHIHRNGLDVSEQIKISEELMNDALLPIIRIDADNSEEERQLRRTDRMLAFEVLHEDALVAESSVISQALFRPPLTRTPFERIVDGRTVEYFMEPGATTLAYAFRKMAHTFYDRPGKRMGALGSEELRNRYMVVNAAMRLYRSLGSTGLSEEEAIREFEQLVSTDEGFPEAFFDTVVDDINTRSSEKDGDFGFYVALPENASHTVQKLRDAGKKVITLFGYSDLGYAQPKTLERQVAKDLSEYDPAKSLVVIGATAMGIGASYVIAKDQGFETRGIVSTKVLAQGGKFSKHVDNVHLVRDTEWGGYLPGTDIVSPTTEAFVSSSDVLLAYGGGNNTAVALREAVKRDDITVKYEPYAMSEESQDNNPYGAASTAWEEINSNRS